MKTKRTIKHLFVYDVTVELCVCDNITKARNSKAALKRYQCRPSEDFPPAGNCVSKGSRIGIYLDKDYIALPTIGHEVHHAVEAVCNWAGVKFDGNEASAHLAGNLLNWVVKQLGDWKIKIK